jgi:ribosomal protein S18 acetylase RimI-like enzyme
MSAIADITYRPATDDDLEATFDVFTTATNDLYGQMGRPQTAGSGSRERALAFRRHALRHDAERFWVAQADSEVVGFAVGILREDVWYLAALHVRPAFQAYGVGSELIRKSLDGTTPAMALTVFTDAINPASNGLYMRFGLLAQEPLLHFDGPIDAARPNWPAVPRAGAVDPRPARLAARAISWPADRIVLEDLDRVTLGAARGIDHELWSGVPTAAGIVFERDGIVRGYAYASASGYLGPVAMHDPVDIAQALDVARLHALSLGATQLHVRTPGSGREAQRWCLEHGLRLSGIGLLLSTSKVGRLDRYVMSGADALF